MIPILTALKIVRVGTGNSRLRYGLITAFAAMTVFAQGVHSREPLTTPLEAAGFHKLSTSAEISAYLEGLAHAYPQARIETFGTSVLGRPLQALLLTGDPGADVSQPNRLTIEIVGSQHGTESAGAETLLFIARDLLTGSLRHVLNEVDIVLVPNANPDGRELCWRANANRVNLNTDFVALTQPESQALIEALRRYRPEVALDVHESAILKRNSLAREGYMTNFISQFETGNNPNIAPVLQSFAMVELLTPWIAAVNDAGVHSHRYVGEIKSANQPITNGGLTLNNLRNRTAIESTLSFLMETRLDPREGNYPTFRNIGERVLRQQISIEQFLRLVHRKRAQALAAVVAARSQDSFAPLALDAQYVASREHPRVTIELRRIGDGVLEKIDFSDHRRVAASTLLSMPAAYVIRADHAKLRGLLHRHGVVYHTLNTTRIESAIEFQAGADIAAPNATLDPFRENAVHLRARPGDLWIELSQPRGRLAALLLEPRSTSSFLHTPEYRSIVVAGKTLPVYRIPRGVDGE